MARGRNELLAAVALVCVLLLVELSCTPCQLALADENYVQTPPMGRAIDIFTNKMTFDGEGPNQESDAYEPQEEVVLYALVTYNRDPVPSKIVTFDIRGPANSAENITLSLSNLTAEDGIATVRFLMPWPDSKPEVAVFGVWSVVATVDIAGVAVADSLSFKAGWLVELLNIKTVDPNNVPKYRFSKGEHICFRLTVRNIAMTSKVATLTVSATDELNAAVGTVKLENEVVPPGENEYLLKEMVIPMTAFVGIGRAVANALKKVQDGFSVPWCPGVETTFEIGVIHDVAVINVVPLVTEVFVGQPVDVVVVAKNKGQARESFSVSAYFDSSLIGTMWVQSLAPGAENTLTFTWSTRGMESGEYRMKATAGPVQYETNLDDNEFINGIVRVKAYQEPTPPMFPISFLWWLLVFFVLVILVAALMIFVLVLSTCRRRRKKKREEGEYKVGRSIEYKVPLTFDRSKICQTCGKEFPAVYTFCPHCLSFHGKD